MWFPLSLSHFRSFSISRFSHAIIGGSAWNRPHSIFIDNMHCCSKNYVLDLCSIDFRLATGSHRYGRGARKTAPHPYMCAREEKEGKKEEEKGKKGRICMVPGHPTTPNYTICCIQLISWSSCDCEVNNMSHISLKRLLVISPQSASRFILSQNQKPPQHQDTRF